MFGLVKALSLQEVLALVVILPAAATGITGNTTAVVEEIAGEMTETDRIN